MANTIQKYIITIESYALSAIDIFVKIDSHVIEKKTTMSNIITVWSPNQESEKNIHMVFSWLLSYYNDYLGHEASFPNLLQLLASGEITNSMVLYEQARNRVLFHFVEFKRVFFREIMRTADEVKNAAVIPADMCDIVVYYVFDPSLQDVLASCDTIIRELGEKSLVFALLR